MTRMAKNGKDGSWMNYQDGSLSFPNFGAVKNKPCLVVYTNAIKVPQNMNPNHEIHEDERDAIT